RRNYKVGLFYNSELFGAFFVPILGVYHLSEDKKFEANITLPNLVDINYKLNNMLTSGLSFVSQIRSYRISNVASGGGPGYLRKGTNEPSLYLKINFTKRSE